MSYLRSLKPNAGLLQIFEAFPEVARPLLEYHEVLLRGESPFSVGERELIAAYDEGDLLLPPINLRSISATRPPRPAVPAAVSSPAVPAPITTTL
jgi:hypothetical protein